MGLLIGASVITLFEAIDVFAVNLATRRQKKNASLRRSPSAGDGGDREAEGRGGVGDKDEDGIGAEDGRGIRTKVVGGIESEDENDTDAEDDYDIRSGASMPFIDHSYESTSL